MAEIGYPKPISTTENLSNVFASFPVLPSNGFLRIIAKTIPTTKANQEEIFNSGYHNERGITSTNPKKRILLKKLFLISVIYKILICK